MKCEFRILRMKKEISETIPWAQISHVWNYGYSFEHSEIKLFIFKYIKFM
jgi:hypothetical protein